MPRYLLDSNFLIQSEHTIPMDIFTGFWAKLAGLLETGDAVLHDTVYSELKVKKDDLVIWIDNNKKIKCMPTSGNALAEHLAMCSWAKRQGYTRDAVRDFSDPNRADAWLCAEAKVSGLSLVTYEKRGASIHKVKIPNVCDAFNITCINGYDFMRATGFAF